MSTTIKYKNNVLATLENESISLKTANTLAEANVEINAVGGDPDGKVYQDQYKYVVLEDGEDGDVETKIRYVKQNELIEADPGEAFNWVDVDVDQVRDLLEDQLINITDVDLGGLETIGDYAFYGRTELKNVSSKTVKTIGNSAFHSSSLKSINVPNAVYINLYAFYKTNVSILYLPKVISLGDYACKQCYNLSEIYLPLVQTIGVQPFTQCTKLSSIVLPSITTMLGAHFCDQNPLLKSADIGKGSTRINASDAFANDSIFNLLILRKSDNIVTLANTASFNGTSFAEGGTGGTIYIPKSLYDHLGDGTALDYKSATNWSTLDSYGAITWAQIEGSEYEHYYADGCGALQDITQNLTNCTIDNDLAHYHTEFVTQIVPDDGYTTISGVSVLMGGVDITSSVYDATSRTITIASPDGEIVINATGGV